MLLSLSCSPARPSQEPEAGLPNPASVHCEENGGRLEFRPDASGGVGGVCVFPDGTECEEWAYFRGECRPGGAVAPPPAEPTPAVPVEFASDGCRVYRNDALGYSFHYPPDAEIVAGDDPLKTVTILGPLVDGEHWPVYNLSHPSDREEYLPPQGADLQQWLTDHYLLMPGGGQAPTEVRLADVSIAGVPAIHTRLARSEQTFAYDKYFFARSQQLYVVVILHAGDREDWDAYNHFLESFQFEP
jgi:putative hemolysin